MRDSMDIRAGIKGIDLDLPLFFSVWQYPQSFGTSSMRVYIFGLKRSSFCTSRLLHLNARCQITLSDISSSRDSYSATSLAFISQRQVSNDIILTHIAATRDIAFPNETMAKRKFTGEDASLRKRAKVHEQNFHDDHISNTRKSDSPYSPSSLTSPERREERKRIRDPQSDSFVEPEAKRAKRSSRESPDLGLEPWPSRHSPCKELNLAEEFSLHEEEFYNRSYKNAMSFFKKYNGFDNESVDHQHTLPSPGASDTETSESDLPTVYPIQARQAIPKISRTLSRQRSKERDMRPPKRKRQRPLRKNRDENKRGNPRNEDLQLIVDEMSRSGRSSRRNDNCRLWQLGNDGTACKVPKAR
ncbi:hypothetical protein GGI35DRAFT_464526 [Trichoderma velutinum]